MTTMRSAIRPSWMTMAMASTTRHPHPPLPPFSSSSSLVAQRTAFVEVKQELTDGIATSHHQQHADMLKDNDEHLCVVCMDNERSCLYVPCNHLVVCVECDADIKAASLPCPYCNEPIDREESVVGLVVA